MFDQNVLRIDAEAEAQRVSAALAAAIRRDLHRQGAVLGISGGVDSAVVLALCVRALGSGRVRALIMPERESEQASAELAGRLAAAYGVVPIVEDITRPLEGFRCYERRDAAIRQIFPEYQPSEGYCAKVTLPPDLLNESTLNTFTLTVVRPDGTKRTHSLSGQEFRQIASASNLKQRTRMATLYLHAELNNYAVVGTANKNEHDLGFFVKYGDGGTDVNPIVHLYKTQVYQLAAFLGVPDEIRSRRPTSDTYSAPSTQEEFFFRLPFEMMDLLWFALDNDVAPAEVAQVMGLSTEQVLRAFADFRSKRRSTFYLRCSPIDFHSEFSKGREQAASASLEPVVAGVATIRP